MLKFKFKIPFVLILILNKFLYSQNLTPFISTKVEPFNQQFFVSNVIDFDNDGDDDVFGWNKTITNSTKLYRNNGNSIFNDVSDSISFPKFNYGVTADFDKNGLMDIYYINGDTLRISLNFGKKFSNPQLSCGQYSLASLFNTQISNIRNIKIGDCDNDGIYDLVAVIVNGTTANVFVKKGILECGSCPYGFNSNASTNIISVSNSIDPQISFADLNNDGFFDLLFAKGTQSTPYGSGYYNFNYSVYLNDGAGKYTLTTTPGLNLGRAFAFGSLGEFNNDGFIDVFSGSADCCVGGTGGVNNINPLYSFFSTSKMNYMSSTTAMTRATDRKYYNRGTVVDINLDKLQDVIWTGIDSYAYSSSALQCYTNNGNNSFSETSSQLGIKLGTSATPVIHSSMVSTMLDINNDKKPDLNIQSFGTYNNTFHENFTMVNNSSNNSVKLKLDACNGLKEGWGARIKYKIDGVWSYQQHTAYSGSNYPFLFLGMSNSKMIDSLVVYWIGGATSVVTNIPAGSFQIVNESQNCTIDSSPAGLSSQNFCFGAKVSDLVATGKVIKWYSQNTGGTPLSSSMPLTNGTTYYASHQVNGCESNKRLSVLVTLTELPLISVAGKSTICQGDSVNLNTKDSPGNIYEWYNNGNLIKNVNTNTYYASISGNYTVKIFNGSCNETSPVVKINTMPYPQVSFILPNYLNINSGTFTLIGNPSGGVFNGKGVSGNILSLLSAGLGKKQITYNYTSDFGCKGTTSLSTIVYDTTACSTFDTLIINLAVSGVSFPDNVGIVKIWPNPANDHITIDNGNFGILNGYSISIVTLLGQEVFKSKIDKQQFYIDLSTWKGKGVYLVNILDNQNKIIEVKNLVLQ